MLNDDLFNEVLIQPAQEGANQLFIVSGYASAAMTFHHFKRLEEINTSIKVSLIVGMTVQDGLSLSNHTAFKKLASEDFQERFECCYITTAPPVHSKVYAWYKDDEPFIGFVGSANYTQKAFGTNQREVMISSDARDSFNYFESLSGDTIYCNHHEAESFVNIFNDQYYARRHREVQQQKEKKKSTPEVQGLELIRVSLLGNNGELPQRSGLNWGQRPEEHREPNQAYIRLTAPIYRSDFFPEIRQHFTIRTDDNKILICTRAQQNGKAIHTPHNNSLIGEYFRNRLGVPNGQPVGKEDLVRYGRTEIDFFKVDEETYYMDFSPPAPKNG